MNLFRLFGLTESQCHFALTVPLNGGLQLFLCRLGSLERIPRIVALFRQPGLCGVMHELLRRSSLVQLFDLRLEASTFVG